MTPTRLKLENPDGAREAATGPGSPRRGSHLLKELAEGLDFLLAQLDASEKEGEELRESNRVLDQLANEQQKALLLSMEMMRRLEADVAALRSRVDGMESPREPSAAPPAVPSPGKSDAEWQVRVEALEQELAKKSAQVEELTAALSQSRPDPGRAMEVLEQQRDQARAELSIQAAEMETKDALIQTLEQALEQQHTALRTLEERFAEYATRLQDLRLDRLQLAGPSRSRGDTAGGTGTTEGLAALAKRLFSRPKALPAPVATEEDSNR